MEEYFKDKADAAIRTEGRYSGTRASRAFVFFAVGRVSCGVSSYEDYI